ncbi:hypothetical protein AX14_006735 [Amanita brunnescens Koide BX004]|nr:hypothetical protein AX14_006735 [Amanita brunnescens Koide BX004]
MSITLDVTGILKAAAYGVSNVSGRNGTKLFIYFYLLITALSGFFGNDPMILSGTLFLVYYTEAAGLDNLPWLMSEFAAANTASMILFVGNPTNVVICEGFGIENAAFTGWTFFPFAACSVTCLGALYAQYRMTGKLSPTLPETRKFRARQAINDLTGAIVGTTLLGGCLITALVVSFVDVDVWKITLPFAGAKFIFDIIWDLYRVNTTGIDELRARMDDSLPQNNRGDSELLPASTKESLSQRDLEWRTVSLSELPAQHNQGDQGLHTVSAASSKTRVEHDASLENSQTAESLHSSPPNTGAEVTSDSTKRMVPNKSSTQKQSSRTSISHIQEPGPTKMSIQKQWWELVPPIHNTVDFVRDHLPTLYNAFPRLPFALVPFAFSQFILIEALAGQGWIDIFARWLVIATKSEMYPTLWIIGVMGVILCNISGTNIGATILLTKVVRAANLPRDSTRAAGIALAVASNIGAVSFVFSASLAGLLWKGIIDDQIPKNKITQRVFAKWNVVPLTVMMGVGLAVVSLEMHIKYR